MAQDVLGLMLHSSIEDNKPLPKASQPKENEIMVSPLPEFSVPLMIYSARTDKGLSKMDVAKKMGITRQAYQRFEFGDSSNITLKTLSRIGAAIGFQTEITARI